MTQTPQGIPPLMRELVALLPPAGQPFPPRARARWLAAAAAVTDLLWPDPDPEPGGDLLAGELAALGQDDAAQPQEGDEDEGR